MPKTQSQSTTKRMELATKYIMDGQPLFNDKPTGTLVGPEGTPPRTLDSRAYTNLCFFLEALDNTDSAVTVEAVRFLLSLDLQNKGLDIHTVLLASTVRFIGDIADRMGHDWASGILGWSVKETGEEGVDTFTIEERVVLQGVLEILRSNSWLSDWLEGLVLGIAKGTTPAKKCPAPSQVMATLQAPVHQFEGSIKTAKAIVEQRPDLFTRTLQKAGRATK